MRELQIFINTMLRDEQVMDEQIKEEKTTGGDPSGDCGRAKDQRADCY